MDYREINGYMHHYLGAWCWRLRSHIGKTKRTSIIYKGLKPIHLPSVCLKLETHCNSEFNIEKLQIDLREFSTPLYIYLCNSIQRQIHSNTTLFDPLNQKLLFFSSIIEKQQFYIFSFQLNIISLKEYIGINSIFIIAFIYLQTLLEKWFVMCHHHIYFEIKMMTCHTKNDNMV